MAAGSDSRFVEAQLAANRAQVEQQIERAWRAAMARPGIQLFDGPMCRLEGLDILPEPDDASDAFADEL